MVKKVNLKCLQVSIFVSYSKLEHVWLIGLSPKRTFSLQPFCYSVADCQAGQDYIDSPQLSSKGIEGWEMPNKYPFGVAIIPL